MRFQVQEVTDSSRWNAALDALGHPLQYWEWGQLKSEGAWTARHLQVSRAGTNTGANTDANTATDADQDATPVAWAQVLTRSMPWPFKSVSYCSRGPLVAPGESREQVLDALADWVKRHVGGVGLTFEPDWEDPDFVRPSRTRPADVPVLLSSTLILDLRLPEEDLWGAISKTTRKQIRRAERAGAQVVRWSDGSAPIPEGVSVESGAQSKAVFDRVLEIYRSTGERAGFAIHAGDYYVHFHKLFGKRALLTTISVPDSEGPDAFLWLALGGETAFELWGGMNERAEELNLNPLLKWHTIQLCRALGYGRYDMNGLLNDGISTFKRRFAKHENQLVPAFTYPFSPLYGVWARALPVARGALRRVRRALGR